MVRRLAHLIWGAEVDRALRPVLLVTLVGSLAGSCGWSFMGIWAVKQLGATSAQLSYAYLLMAVVGGLVGYVAGHLSDIYGRRRLILLGQGLLAVYVLLFLGAGDRVWFGIALMVGAGALGSLGGSSGQAMVADLVAPERHEAAYASVRVAANLGVTMGPPIGSLFLIVGGWTLFFPCVSLLALGSWGLAFRYLPKRGAYAPEGPPERGSLGVILQDRTFLVFMAASVFASLVYVAYETVLPISLVESHGVPAWGWGLLLVVNPLLVTLFQLRLTRRVARVPAWRKWVASDAADGPAVPPLRRQLGDPRDPRRPRALRDRRDALGADVAVDRGGPRARGPARRLHGRLRRCRSDGLGAGAVPRPPGQERGGRHGDVGRVRRRRARGRRARGGRLPRCRPAPHGRAGLCCTCGMKREERELILKQGVVSPETPRDRREHEALAEDIRSSPLRGRPLRLRLRNFRPDGAGYLSALGGPLPFMVRLREITEQTAAHERRLEEAWRMLAATGLDEEAFAAAWRAEVAAWSFDEVNDLIDRHNRYYPAESRLPMDPQHAHVRARRRAGLPPPSARRRLGARAVSRRPRRSYGTLTLLPSWAGPGSSTLRWSRSSVRSAMTAQITYGAGSPTASASAPPAAGPVMAPIAQAVFIRPKASVWGIPFASARSETSAMPGA